MTRCKSMWYTLPQTSFSNPCNMPARCLPLSPLKALGDGMCSSLGPDVVRILCVYKCTARWSSSPGCRWEVWKDTKLEKSKLDGKFIQAILKSSCSGFEDHRIERTCFWSKNVMIFLSLIKCISGEVAGKHKNMAHITDVSQKLNSLRLQKQFSLIQILKD